MSAVKLFTWLYSVSLFIEYIASENGTLRLVHVLGMQQEYELGSYLKTRYEGFLNKTYQKSEIYVRSTDKDRTLMSAQAVLAGLYPPYGGQLWNPDIKWQPIPVHTIPFNKDPLLKPGAPCPAYEEIFKKVLSSGEAIEYQQDNKEFLQQLRQNTGMLNASLYDLMITVPDPLLCEKIHKKQWVSWVTDDLFNRIWTLKNLEFKFYFYTPTMTRFQGGVFLYELLTNTRNAIASSFKKGPKMYMYSAHDDTLSAIMHGLGVWDGQIPPYSSSLMLELYETNPTDYYIQVWYRNSSTQDPVAKPNLLTLDDCESDCEFSQFDHLTEPMTIQGIDAFFKECGHTDHSPQFPGNTVAIVLCAVVLVVIFGIVFLMCYRRKKDYPYHSANFNEPPES